MASPLLLLSSSPPFTSIAAAAAPSSIPIKVIHNGTIRLLSVPATTTFPTFQSQIHTLLSIPPSTALQLTHTDAEGDRILIDTEDGWRGVVEFGFRGGDKAVRIQAVELGLRSGLEDVGNGLENVVVKKEEEDEGMGVAVEEKAEKGASLDMSDLNDVLDELALKVKGGNSTEEEVEGVVKELSSRSFTNLDTLLAIFKASLQRHGVTELIPLLNTLASASASSSTATLFPSPPLPPLLDLEYTPPPYYGYSTTHSHHNPHHKRRERFHPYAARRTTRTEPGGWDGVTCDGCGRQGWKGSRYKCCVCTNFDLCGTCWGKLEISRGEEEKKERELMVTMRSSVGMDDDDDDEDEDEEKKRERKEREREERPPVHPITHPFLEVEHPEDERRRVLKEKVDTLMGMGFGVGEEEATKLVEAHGGSLARCVEVLVT
ncbi:hypothetical protein HDU97_001862 [Phlyctochytrium planicorne]|nr:hypothetical protein HDU97_001862 [Phlyctochytrium planicorne]